MTIKQNGGIFGRNPTFNDVTSNDITTENLYVYHPTTNQIAKFESGDATAQIVVSDNVADVRIKNTAGKMLLEADPNADGAGSYLRFTVDGSTAAEFTASGNLAFPSGQGIDFSATSGTGTSELFDDYEEGLWSPTVDIGTCDVQYGSYIKIGKMVHATFSIANLSDTTTASAINVSLPFTAGSFSASEWFGSWIIRRYNVSTSVSGAMRVLGGGTTMDFRYSDTTVGSEPKSVNYADNTSGTNEYLAGSITYFAAS